MSAIVRGGKVQKLVKIVDGWYYKTADKGRGGGCQKPEKNADIVYGWSLNGKKYVGTIYNIYEIL